MTNETPETAEKDETVRSIVVDKGKKAYAAADRAATMAEQTSGFFSAVKWVAIAVVMLVLLFGGWTIYKAVTVPAKAVGSAVGGMSDAVKAGGEKVMDGSTEILNRLVIAIDDQNVFDKQAEAAFESLTTMTPVEADGIKERLAWSKDFSGHEGRVCQFNVRRDEIFLPVTLAADNKAYATAKALGSKNERLIRMILTAGDTDVAMRAEWDPDIEGWVLKWRSTTLKKPVEDKVALERAIDVLDQAVTDCK